MSHIEVVAVDDGAELWARVESRRLREPFSLYFRVPAELGDRLCKENGDPFLAALLLPAMKAAEPLEIDAPISARLRQSVRQIQATFRVWHPRLAEVEIRAPVRSQYPPPPDDRGVGLFFSLGVDSFHTLIEGAENHAGYDQPISHLILVDGFGGGSKDESVWRAVVANTERVAREFGKRALIVKTNLRPLTRRFVAWGKLAHGPALASVGLALQQAFRQVYISSSTSVDQLEPWSSHPMVDPLWSNESLDVLHAGCETPRMRKVGAIAAVPIVRETLRVCNDVSTPAARAAYNCGACNKCARVALDLHIAGALAGCETLPRSFGPEMIQRFRLKNLYWAAITRPRLGALGSSTEDEAIRAALQAWFDREVARLEARARATANGQDPGDRADSLAALRAENAALRSESDKLRARLAAVRQKLDAERARSQRPKAARPHSRRSKSSLS